MNFATLALRLPYMDKVLPGYNLSNKDWKSVFSLNWCIFLASIWSDTYYLQSSDYPHVGYTYIGSLNHILNQQYCTPVPRPTTYCKFFASSNGSGAN